MKSNKKCKIWQRLLPSNNAHPSLSLPTWSSEVRGGTGIDEMLIPCINIFLGKQPRTFQDKVYLTFKAETLIKPTPENVEPTTRPTSGWLSPMAQYDHLFFLPYHPFLTQMILKCDSVSVIMLNTVFYVFQHKTVT